jgi:DNA polymerase-3 subunit gamma/tau
MIIIKLCYATSLPDPSDLMDKISSEKALNKRDYNEPNINTIKNPEILNVETKPSDSNDNKNIKTENPKNFEEMLTILLQHKEALLHAQIINNVHLISYKEGFIEIRLKDNSDNEILKKLSFALEKITQTKWIIKLSNEEGDKTIIEKQNIQQDKTKEDIKLNPNVAEVFKQFPEATITSIKNS